MGSDNESGGQKGSAPLIQAFPNRVDPFLPMRCLLMSLALGGDIKNYLTFWVELDCGLANYSRISTILMIIYRIFCDGQLS